MGRVLAVSSPVNEQSNFRSHVHRYLLPCGHGSLRIIVQPVAGCCCRPTRPISSVPDISKRTEAGTPFAVTVVRPLGIDSLRRQNSWKNMSEIKFLQSGSGLDIASHAPCAIDRRFESVDKLYHLWFWAQNRVVDSNRTSSHWKRAEAARVSRFLAGGEWALRRNQRPRRAPSHCPSHHLVGESRRIFSSSDAD